MNNFIKGIITILILLPVIFAFMILIQTILFIPFWARIVILIIAAFIIIYARSGRKL